MVVKFFKQVFINNLVLLELMTAEIITVYKKTVQELNVPAFLHLKGVELLPVHVAQSPVSCPQSH